MTASPEQLHAALTYCIEFAKQMLADSQAFYPFGASLNRSGKVEALGGWNGEEHPEPAEVYGLLSGALQRRARAKEILGAALAVDVNVPPQYGAQWPDGIRVHLESADFSRHIYVPYRIVKSGGPTALVELAEPFSVEVGHEFFG